MSAEEKLETMQRERLAYNAGYRSGLRWAVISVAIFLVIVFLASAAIVIITI